MSFARDKLYNGYVRPKMAVFASDVKSHEIAPHLPCLTLSDREEIAAKRDLRGNYDAMQHLLDCLRRRENWPEEFIAALRACEHRSAAAQMEAEYDRLKAPGDPKPPSAAAPSAVVTATVHSPPPVGLPASSSSSLRETPEVFQPLEESSSEPGARTPPDPRKPSTPPRLEATLPSPQARVPAPQEPEEISEEELEEIVRVAGGPGAAGDLRDGCEVTAATETRRSSDPSWPPAARGVDSSEDLSSESVTLTPEKPPVQDSQPPKLLLPSQVKRSLQPAVAAVVAAAVAVAAAAAPVEAAWRRPDDPEPAPAGRWDPEDDPCLSKPGALLSVQPGAAQHATLPDMSPLEPSFSGNVSLQISDPEPEGSGTHPPFSGNDVSLQISDPEPEGSGTRPRGSSPGFPPQENPYPSYDLASFSEQEVLEHVGHVTEEPSIQNLASPMQGILGNAVHASQEQQHWKNEGDHKISVQNPPGGGEGGDGPHILNGKATPALALEQGPARHQHSGAKLQDEPEEELAAVSALPRTKYVITAAGIAACAMFVAWKLKN